MNIYKFLLFVFFIVMFIANQKVQPSEERKFWISVMTLSLIVCVIQA